MFGKCSILKNSARRTVGGSIFSLNEPNDQETPNEEAASLPPPSTGGRSMSFMRPHRSVRSTDRIDFDAFELDESSEQMIEALEEDDEVVVLMPGKEFVIPAGPKRTVLYWLCRSVALTEKINGFLEGELSDSRV